MLFQKNPRRVLERELRDIENQEMKLANAAYKVRKLPWKDKLESALPGRTREGIEKAFAAGLGLLVGQGSSLLEKSYDRETLQREFALHDARLRTAATRRELRELTRASRSAALTGTAVAAAEGAALGALGIGMPDIVFFLATLIRALMQSAARYGLDTDSPAGRLMLLHLLETPLLHERDWTKADRDVDALLRSPPGPVEEALFDAQVKRTAAAFAVDLLALKFIQGIPVVGVLGGAANPVYYRRITAYAELKFRKRYIVSLMQSMK